MIFRFGEFELDEDRALLLRAGVPVAIQPKALALLRYLIRARHRVTDKVELLAKLWPDVVVGDQSVTRAVNGARVALGDDGEGQRFIRTIPRRGYRFVAEVEERVASGPAAAPATAPDVFVGRTSLLATLRSELGSAFAGQPRIVLLEGEAGIGKTRAAHEAGRMAQELGARVHLGWCEEGDATAPFQPWRTLMHALISSHGWERMRATLPSASADVIALLWGSDPVAALEAREIVPGEARLRLFEAIATVIRLAAAEAPLLLVIDDLHAADVGSLRLLEFVSRELGLARVGILATLCDEALPLSHPAVRTLAELARRGCATRLTLTRLERDDVTTFIEYWTGQEPAPGLAQEIFERSEGNPFFVRELALWLGQQPEGGAKASGARAPVPPNVRDIVRRRLQIRSAVCVEALGTASVIGREVDLDVLACVADRPREQIAAALEEAVAGHLMVEDETRPGRFRFAHALIQETLLAEQSALRVAAIHRATADAMAALDGSDDARLAERARHACDGADATTAEAAILLAIRAGHQAMSLMAYENAAQLYRRALATVGVLRAVAPQTRCDALLALGRALSHAGDPGGADEAFHEAEEIARRIEDPHRKVRASLGVMGGTAKLSSPSIERVLMAEEATAQLGPEDEALRILALGRLSLAWRAAGEGIHAIELAEEALRRAQALGQPRLVASAMIVRSTVSPPIEDPAVRVARTDAALDAVEDLGAGRIELESRIQRASALLELGRIDDFRSEIDAHARLAESLREPVALWQVLVHRALCHAIDGELDAAEEWASRAVASGRRAGHPDALPYFALQISQIRYFQGRMGELEEPLRRLIHVFPHSHGRRAALALTLAETGRTEEARQQLERIAANDFAHLRHDAGWLGNLTVLSLVAATLRDVPCATQLYERLVLYRERNVSAHLVATNGSACHFLGILALTLGQVDRAIAHGEEALATNRRMGIAPWTAWSAFALARALHAGDRPGNGERVVALATEALASGTRMGLVRLVQQARALVAEVGPRIEPGRVRPSLRIVRR